MANKSRGRQIAITWWNSLDIWSKDLYCEIMFGKERSWKFLTGREIQMIYEYDKGIS